jgi:hypothetical protein
VLKAETAMAAKPIVQMDMNTAKKTHIKTQLVVGEHVEFVDIRTV